MPKPDHPAFAPGAVLPHLAGEGASLRQAMAAHFLKDFDHIVEIGGAGAPITGFVRHRPKSVLVIDPKIEPYESATLNGGPCRVRHVAAKIQQAKIENLEPGYALVLVGLSLKAYGSKAAVPGALASLCDGAKRIVAEHAAALGRAQEQIGPITSRPGFREIFRVDFRLSDAAISGSGFEERRLIVVEQGGGPLATSAVAQPWRGA